MRLFGFLLALLLGATMVAQSYSAIDVMAPDVAMRSSEFGSELSVDWAKVLAGVLGVVTSLVSVIVGPRAGELLRDMLERIIPARALPDEERQREIDGIVRWLIATDRLDDTEKQALFGKLVEKR